MGPEVIRSGRLELVPVGVGHAAEMAGALGDPGLHTFIGGAPDAPDALRARYERWVAGSPDPDVLWWNWVIRLRDEGCLVGTVQATVSLAGTGGTAEVAWVVGTPWQGRGIATEAAGALVDRIGQRGIASVIAHIHPEHHASAAVAAAAGLTPSDAWQDGERRWQRDFGRQDD